MARFYQNPQAVILEDLSKLIRQPDGDMLIQDDTGSWTHTVVYRCRWNDAIGLAPRRYIDRSPDYTYLICDGIKIAKEKPGIARMTVTYVGNQDGAGGTGLGGQFEEIEELNKNSRQEDIQKHPKFKDGSWDAFKIVRHPDTGEEVLLSEITDQAAKDKAEFLRFSNNSDGIAESLAGEEDYIAGGAEFRKTFQQSSKPSGITVGTIDTPSGAPTVSGSYDWLATGESWARQGGKYRITRTWMLSGPNGWNKEVYGNV